MAAIKYKIKLTGSERTCLNEVSHRLGASAHRQRALALQSPKLRDREIADVRQRRYRCQSAERFVEEGLEAAINDRPRHGPGAQAGRQAASAPDRRPRAAPRPKGTRTGHSSCWPTRWWSWSLPRASPWRRCARYSKKRTQALEEERVVYPQGERGVRGADGGRPPVPTSTKSWAIPIEAQPHVPWCPLFK